MINKKNVLGKLLDVEDLSQRDAIHTAIVAVRAGQSMEPGTKCIINEYNEAIPGEKNFVGVADPFLKKLIPRGSVFHLLLGQSEVPNVTHVWEHPTITFAKPTREIVYNRTLQGYANDYGVSYEDIMKAADYVYEKESPYPYPGKKTQEEFEEVYFDTYDFWSEWGGEVHVEFENMGTECCPEYAYPDAKLFKFVE